MKHNKLTGKAAEERPWVNYPMASYRPVAPPRGENRASRRARDKEVRLEIKRLNAILPTLDPDSDKFKELDLRKGELQLYEASPHAAINKPYVKRIR